MTKHYTAKYTDKKGKTGLMQFARVNVPEDEDLSAAQSIIQKEYADRTFTDFKEVAVKGNVLQPDGTVGAPPPVVATVEPKAQIVKP